MLGTKGREGAGPDLTALGTLLTASGPVMLFISNLSTFGALAVIPHMQTKKAFQTHCALL